MAPGWSRLVAALAKPLALDEAELRVDAQDGSAALRIALAPVNQAAFDASAGAPRDPRWDLPAATAILDRFLHRDEIITIRGKSYRLQQQPQNPRGMNNNQ